MRHENDLIFENYRQRLSEEGIPPLRFDSEGMPNTPYDQRGYTDEEAREADARERFNNSGFSLNLAEIDPEDLREMLIGEISTMDDEALRNIAKSLFPGLEE